MPAGIENVLALRGDVAADRPPDGSWYYHYASELIREMKSYGGFCIGGACYPESHPESKNQVEDIAHLREKVDAGCEFLTTQMFFDNNIYYNFLYKVREAGITVPIVAGIMPVTNVKQIKRIVELSGTALPQRFRYLLEPVWQHSGRHEAGGHHLCFGADYRPVGQRRAGDPRIFYEQRVGSRADSKQFIGDFEMTAPVAPFSGVLPPLPRKNIFRYLGMGRAAEDPAVAALVDECLPDFLDSVHCRGCYTRVAVRINGEDVDFGAGAGIQRQLIPPFGGMRRGDPFCGDTGAAGRFAASPGGCDIAGQGAGVGRYGIGRYRSVLRSALRGMGQKQSGVAASPPFQPRLRRFAPVLSEGTAGAVGQRP